MIRDIAFGWDYTDWPIFRSTVPGKDDPDVRQLVSRELEHELLSWGKDMGKAYSDETGRVLPPRSVANSLDARFDDLAMRLRSEGIHVIQEDKWWRRPDTDPV